MSAEFWSGERSLSSFGMTEKENGMCEGSGQNRITEKDNRIREGNGRKVNYRERKRSVRGLWTKTG
jgi:hypothetical protein